MSKITFEDHENFTQVSHGSKKIGKIVKTGEDLTTTWEIDDSLSAYFNIDPVRMPVRGYIERQLMETYPPGYSVDEYRFMKIAEQCILDYENGSFFQ